MAQGSRAFSLAFMTHPARAQMFFDLTVKLGFGETRDLAGLPVSEVQIALDTDGDGCWPTARAAWARGLNNPPHHWHMVMQDDAEPCAHFLHLAAAALAAAPLEAKAVSFFWRASSDQEDRAARHSPAPWIRMRTCQTGVCVAMRSGDIKPWLAWVDARVQAKCPSYDQRLSMWLWHRRYEAWFTMPSLVDHIGEHSLMGHDMPGRRATVFADHRLDAGFPWACGEYAPPLLGRDETPRMTAWEK